MSSTDRSDVVSNAALSLYAKPFKHIDRVFVEEGLCESVMHLRFESGPQYGMDTLHQITVVSLKDMDSQAVQVEIECAFRQANVSFGDLKKTEARPLVHLPGIREYLKTRVYGVLITPSMLKKYDLVSLDTITPIPHGSKKKKKEEAWDMKDCW